MMEGILQHYAEFPDSDVAFMFSQDSLDGYFIRNWIVTKKAMTFRENFNNLNKKSYVEFIKQLHRRASTHLEFTVFDGETEHIINFTLKGSNKALSKIELGCGMTSLNSLVKVIPKVKDPNYYDDNLDLPESFNLIEPPATTTLVVPNGTFPFNKGNNKHYTCLRSQPPICGYF